MIYVKTGDERLDAMVMALASRCTDDTSPDVAVCAEGETVPSGTTRLIIIYSDKSYDAGALHREYLSLYGDSYIHLSRPLSVRKLDIALRRLSRGDERKSHSSNVSVYDKESRVLTKSGKSITLTEREAELYLILREAEGSPVSRDELRRRLWGNTNGTNAPEVCVSYLRRKLSQVLGEGALVNVRGVGYLLKEE